MAILGAWTSLAEAKAVGGLASVYTSTQKAPYVTEGINLGALDGNVFVSFDIPSVNDFWLSWHLYLTNINASNQVLWQMYGTDGTALFRLVVNASSSSILDAQVWTGSAWSTVGSASLITIRGTFFKIDVRLKIADAGIFNVYVNSQDLILFSGDTLRTAVTDVNVMRFGVSYSNSNTEVVSAIILADEPTFDLIFAQNLPTGNGGQTAWTGDYTAVDETGYSNLDFISSDTVSQVETFTFAALNAALNVMDVYSVINSVVARVGASGPGNITGLVRAASTNYDASDYSPPVGQFKPKQIIMNTNPSTSSPWSISEVNSHEIGFKSKA